MVDEFMMKFNIQKMTGEIETPQGIQWLTIPVRQESLDQKIKDTKISDKKWNIKHFSKLFKSKIF